MSRDLRKKNIHWGQIVLKFILFLLALGCFLPVFLVLIISLTPEESILTKGYSYLPTSVTIQAYKYIGSFWNQLARAYGVTLFETVIGTVWTILLCAMFGYVLSRKSFRWRNILSIFLLITMLFNGGQVANYIVRAGWYGLKNNLMVLILPGVSAYTCIVMRSFIQQTIPDSLVESAKIDGAGEMLIFRKVVLPLIIPALAAMGFMQAVGHWNEWQTAYLYIDNPKYSTLQLVLIRIENNLAYLKQNMASLSPEESAEFANMPNVPTRMAILMVTLGPILVIYPFFQKHFIKGMTIGAVKG